MKYNTKLFPKILIFWGIILVIIPGIIPGIDSDGFEHIQDTERSREVHVIGGFRKATVCGLFECRWPQACGVLSRCNHARAGIRRYARLPVHVHRSGNHFAWGGRGCSPPHRCYLLRACTVRVGERAAHRRRCPLTIAGGDAEATAALRRTGNVDLSRCCSGYDFGDHSGGHFGDCVGIISGISWE